MSHDEEIELQSVLPRDAIQPTTPVDSSDAGQALDNESPKKIAIHARKTRTSQNLNLRKLIIWYFIWSSNYVNYQIIPFRSNNCSYIELCKISDYYVTKLY